MWTPLQLFKWSIAPLRQTTTDAYNCYLIKRLLHMIYIFVICGFLSFCELHIISAWLIKIKDVSIKCSVCRIWTLQMTMLFDIIQTSSQLFKWSLAFAPSTYCDAYFYVCWHILHAFIYIFIALLKLIIAMKFLSELCRIWLTFNKIHFEILFT